MGTLVGMFAKMESLCTKSSALRHGSPRTVPYTHGPRGAYSSDVLTSLYDRESERSWQDQDLLRSKQLKYYVIPFDKNNQINKKCFKMKQNCMLIIEASRFS